MHRSFLLLAVAALPALVKAVPFSTTTQDTASRSEQSIAPLVADDHPYGTVNNSYIVVFNEDVPDSLVDNHFDFLQRVQDANPLPDDPSGVTHVYTGPIDGYAGLFSTRVIEELRLRPEVKYVERDQVVRKAIVQDGAPWGLARLSHRTKLISSTATKYEYDASGGEGVDVYVIDTGININHVEFEGRASWGKTVPRNEPDVDGNGHGTHCAGTIASKTYGVAKQAKVIAIKVLNASGNGAVSDVIDGIAFAAEQAARNKKIAEAEMAATGKSSHKGSVANMSLGGGKSLALNQAVNAAVDSGLHFAVAAGNDNRDACNYSPASAEKVVTVGASTVLDSRAYFSNWGACVDVFAPGLSILSTWTGSTNATATISGTSMASPHIAGLLAYYLSIYPSPTFDPTANQLAPLILSPAQLKQALLNLATRSALSGLPLNTVNLLGFNNATDGSSFV